ncbi:MAG: RsmE family RNA methyltransferase [Candidatus Dadabacteria bacterium]
MNLPFFYHENLSNINSLDEDTSKYLVNVLRRKIGDEVILTDGKGTKAFGSISDDNRKRSVIKVHSTVLEEKRKPHISVAISLIKNSSRFEWFLEKAAEIGVNEIIPCISRRTEKQNFKPDRMKSILVSAMLQSQQTWLTQLHQPLTLQEIFRINAEQKYIAHCLEDNKQHLSTLIQNNISSLVLIGPEGDFTTEEIQSAIEHDFIPVTLGDTRLRTETAGIVAAVIMSLQKLL